MISAFARARKFLEEPRYLESATRAAKFLEANLYDESNRLLTEVTARAGETMRVSRMTTPL